MEGKRHGTGGGERAQAPQTDGEADLVQQLRVANSTIASLKEEVKRLRQEEERLRSLLRANNKSKSRNSTEASPPFPPLPSPSVLATCFDHGRATQSHGRVLHHEGSTPEERRSRVVKASSSGLDEVRHSRREGVRSHQRHGEGDDEHNHQRQHRRSGSKDDDHMRASVQQRNDRGDPRESLHRRSSKQVPDKPSHEAGQAHDPKKPSPFDRIRPDRISAMLPPKNEAESKRLLDLVWPIPLFDNPFVVDESGRRLKSRDERWEKWLRVGVTKLGDIFSTDGDVQWSELYARFGNDSAVKEQMHRDMEFICNRIPSVYRQAIWDSNPAKLK